MSDDPLREAALRLNRSFGKARCEPGWNWRPAPLPDYDLWYVVSGRGTIRIGEEFYAMSKGHCCLVRPGDEPVGEQDPEDRLTVVFVHFSCDAPIEAQIPRHNEVRDSVFMENVLNRLLEALAMEQSWSAGEAESLLKLALYELLRGTTPLTGDVSDKRRHTVLRIKAMLRENNGARMTVQEAAETAGYSAEYLSVLFKQTTGESLQGYLTRMRMERAMQLLTETSMNISQIADALGYGTVFLFSRQFKRHFGSPPSPFQRKSVAPEPHGRAEAERGSLSREKDKK